MATSPHGGSGSDDRGALEDDSAQSIVLGPRLLHSITLQNLLSFSPENEPLELRSLNVLIGPNGSGKSNLLEAISLLRATPGDLRKVISRGGGVMEWIWKGQPDGVAKLDVNIAAPETNQTVRHFMAFHCEEQSFRLTAERIEDEHAAQRESDPYYEWDGVNRAVLRAGNLQLLRSGLGTDMNRSVLAQLSDPEIYPQLTFLKEAYERIRLFREWTIGRGSVLRVPQKTDLRTDRLEEDFSNLGLFLNQLRSTPKVKRTIVSHLQDLYENLADFDLSIKGGTVQLFFTEGDFTVPATRLSDGSLRYLCLLAILCDPDPPPLIGIEEPELGLHPDLMPKMADLLVDASSRCQLIVTTHSDILVDALSGQPESIVVCEKVEGRTLMRRLDAKELAPWLEKYRLGQLWTSGELGGTRW